MIRTAEPNSPTGEPRHRKRRWPCSPRCTNGWVMLLRSLPPAAFSRTLRHPELGVLSIDALLSYYGWHGQHHVAHIIVLRSRDSSAHPAGLGTQ